jgi:putative ABC transport system substrate-binding protein
MGKRIFPLALSAMLFALCSSAEAQQPKKVARIGVLTPFTSSRPALDVEAFLEGMRELGYVEGQNVTIEYRYAEGKYDRLPNLATDLVRLKVDVIFANSAPAVQAAKQATTSIPIVMETLTDPVLAGFVASLARPGSNITGGSPALPRS